jgi:hypothetical protein
MRATERQPTNYPERLGVPVKTVLDIVLDQKAIQFFLGNVAKRRMAQIVGESRRFGYVGVDAAQ